MTRAIALACSTKPVRNRVCLDLDQTSGVGGPQPETAPTDRVGMRSGEFAIKLADRWSGPSVRQLDVLRAAPRRIGRIRRFIGIWRGADLASLRSFATARDRHRHDLFIRPRAAPTAEAAISLPAGIFFDMRRKVLINNVSWSDLQRNQAAVAGSFSVLCSKRHRLVIR
jgi:hypothetical protein